MGPVDKLKNYDLLYGIITISISGGHSYDGEAGQPDPDDDIDIDSIIPQDHLLEIVSRFFRKYNFSR